MLLSDFISFCKLGQCQRGLTVLDYPVQQTVWAWTVPISLMLAVWSTFFLWIHKYRPVWRITGILILIAFHHAATIFLQPRHPYWIWELSIMLAHVSTWKLLDFAFYRQEEKLHGLGGFFLDDVLVLRPPMVHATLKKDEWDFARTSMLARFTAAFPCLLETVMHLCLCEALNAYLMQHSTSHILNSSFVIQSFYSCLMAAALFTHMSYFYSIMAFSNIVLRGVHPRRWTPPAFTNPFLAGSPSDLWNNRWHQMFRWWLVRLVYQPLHHLIKSQLRQEGRGGWLSRAVPSLAVFVVCGCFHELLIYTNLGTPGGEQLLFFIIHGMALALQRWIERSHPKFGTRLPRLVKVALFQLFLAATLVIFMRPWFKYGYHLEYRVVAPGPVHKSLTSWTQRLAL